MTIGGDDYALQDEAWDAAREYAPDDIDAQDHFVTGYLTALRRST